MFALFVQPSLVTATLNQTYKVTPGQPTVAPTPAELPVPAGNVQALWYQHDGRYIVVYAGLDLDQSGPLCPGNSIQTAAGFEHISNAPTEPGACSGVPILAGADAGVRIRGALAFYLTEIPTTAEGTLYGTVERYDDGVIVGLTSTAQTNLAATPELDPDVAAYSLPPGVLPSGSTEVTC